MSKTTKTTIGLILFCLVLYGLFIAAIPLLDPDEPVYGETAKEMLNFHDWLSPRIYGEFWYDKPPLFYWLDAISFSIFGVSTWSARLPSVLMGTGTAVYVFRSSISFLGERTARIAAFILASSLEIVILARSAVTDMTLVFALTVALISFYKKKYVTAYIACGFALLAKGPIGFGFPALIVGIYLILTRKWNIKEILGLKWYWGIPLACLVGLPWFIYMGMVHGAPFIDTFLGYHNITRFVSPEHAGQNHIWLFIVVLIAGFFPWTGTLPGLLRRIVRWRHDDTAVYLAVWAGFIFIFFSISSTQLFSYILPMYPPLAMLAAKYLVSIEEEGHISKTFLACHTFFILLVAAAIAASPVVPASGYWAKFLLAAVLAVLGFLSAYRLKSGNFHMFYITQGLISLMLTLSVWGVFASAVSGNFASYGIGEKLASTSLEKNIPLYIDSFYRPSTAFYFDIYGKPLPSFDKQAAAKEKTEENNGVYLPGNTDSDLPDTAYVLVQGKSYNRWPEDKKEHLTLIWQKDTALLFKKEVTH